MNISMKISTIYKNFYKMITTYIMIHIENCQKLMYNKLMINILFCIEGRLCCQINQVHHTEII